MEKPSDVLLFDIDKYREGILKISFLMTIFSQRNPQELFELDSEGISGLYYILRDISQCLSPEAVVKSEVFNCCCCEKDTHTSQAPEPTQN